MLFNHFFFLSSPHTTSFHVMASSDCNVSSSDDSYADVFQVVTIIVPICPYKEPHHIDIHSKCFRSIISHAVCAALAQYMRKENPLDRLQRAGQWSPPENEAAIAVAEETSL